MGDAATESELRELEARLYQAMITQDFAALDRLLADDVVYVHSTAVAESKAEYFAGVRKGLYDYERIESRSVGIRLCGDVAVMNGTVDMSVGARGQRKDLIHLLFVLVWAKRAGDWKLVHRHATRMPAA